MAETPSQPVFLDTTVLSNFASTNSVEALDAVLETIVVVESVRDELERGVRHGHEYLEAGLAYVESEFEVEVAPDETSDSPDVHDRLDQGEAAAFLGARRRGGTLATDDLAARRLATENDVDITGSVGLLVLGVERNHLSIERADDWLDTWRRKRGYYAPVDSVADLWD